MLLSIQELEVRKIRFETDYRPGTLEFSSSGVRQISPLHTSGVAELLPHTGGEVRVQGRLSVTLEADCDRCLCPARYSLDAPFDLFYEPSTALEPGDEIAIDEGQSEMGFYEGDGIELEEMLQEQVLLLLPMHRLCKEDCGGICPVCGQNRNENPCNCSSSRADDRWSSLKQFKVG